MKIALVAPSPIPFAVGGAEKLFVGMLERFNALSVHDLELIKLPCRDQEFWPLMECYRRFSQLRLDHFDAIISTKYPAWMVSHPHHILYMQHTCRGVYDLYEGEEEFRSLLDAHPLLEELRPFLLDPAPDRSMLEPFFDLLDRIRHREEELPAHAFAFPGSLSRAVIHWLDRIALAPGEIAAYYAISRTVARRPGYFPPRMPVTVVYHPSPLATRPASAPGECLFTVSRLEDLKRVDLLIDAYGKVESDLPFYIAGTGGRQEALRERARGDDRIRFLGFVGDEELARWYRRALFVPFVPYDEDFGLVTLEAMSSSRAVLTARDSGGVTELVEEGHTGRIVEPDADVLASTMQAMLDDGEGTRRMGERALEHVAPIDWSNLIAVLLGEEALREPLPTAPRAELCFSATPSDREEEKGTLRILQLATFPIFPSRSGGQIRVAALARELSRDARVTLMSLGHRDRVQRLSSSLMEISFRRPVGFYRQAELLESRTGVSSEDLALLGGWRRLKRFVEMLRARLAENDIVLLEGPYLEPMLRELLSERRCRGLPVPRVVYSAHNVEYTLKSSLYRDPSEAERIRCIEERCCREADLIVACSEEDAEGLRQLYGSRPLPEILLVPNGVDMERIAPLEGEERRQLRRRMGLERPVALFAGSRHAPNIEALEAIVRWARELPGIIFLIVGNVADALEEDIPSNLFLLGELDDKSKCLFLSLADIGLNPVISGSGSNLKLIEYLAWGLCTLSTPFGTRGFDFVDGRELMVAPIEEFPVRLQELEKDFSRCGPMLQAARRAARHYDWKRLVVPLATHLSAWHREKQLQIN